MAQYKKTKRHGEINETLILCNIFKAKLLDLPNYLTLSSVQILL